jgi:hypothetical protein
VSHSMEYCVFFNVNFFTEDTVRAGLLELFADFFWELLFGFCNCLDQCVFTCNERLYFSQLIL